MLNRKYDEKINISAMKKLKNKITCNNPISICRLES